MNNCQKLSELLPSGIDCALVTSDINRRYLTGMKSSAGYIVVLPEKSYLLIDFRYYEKAKNTVLDCEVVRYTSLKDNLGDIITKHNIKNIAIESKTLTIGELETFKRLFSDIDFVSDDTLSNLINNLRVKKSAFEIECITKAQRIAEAAFDELLNFISVDKTERDLALYLDYQMQKGGSEGVSFETIVLSGANTSMPHGVPGDKKIADNEFLLFDFGAVYNGYHSDMTRTVCLGNPTDEMVKVYDTVLKAQLASLEKIKAGESSKEIDFIARKIISDAGYGDCFGHSLGHGVGLEIHELPTASPNSDMILDENMILTVEPGIYLPSKFGVRIEDFVQITAFGCENITKTKKNLICL